MITHSMPSFSAPTRPHQPRAMKASLDQYVIGQDAAKRILSVAVFNHNLRCQQASEQAVAARADHHESVMRDEASGPDRDSVYPTSVPDPTRMSGDRSNSQDGQMDAQELRTVMSNRELLVDIETEPTTIEKSNVLLFGPTGSGKTLLARTLAKLMDVPFSISDCTPFTQAGYVGEDVEVCVQRLLIASGWDVSRAERGIIVLDEVDKIARRADGMAGKDVSGEGVQQALLKILEGTILQISDKGQKTDAQRSRTGLGLPGSSGSASAPSKGEIHTIDTSNILFLLTGAFVGLDRVVTDRVSKNSIGFGSTIQSTSKTRLKPAANTPKPFFSPNAADDYEPLQLVEPQDLVSYGLIPELVGRCPIFANCLELTIDDLLRVLTEPRNALVSQYKSLFAAYDVTLHITVPALREIARQAIQMKTGARGLRRLMETLLCDAMFETPESSVKYALVTQSTARKESPVMYFSRGQGYLFHGMIAAEEEPVQSHDTTTGVPGQNRGGSGRPNGGDGGQGNNGGGGGGRAVVEEEDEELKEATSGFP